MKQAVLGIVVGGGPAPGINGVIGSATIEAVNSGMKVIGMMDGFKWLVRNVTTNVTELTIDEVSRIHFSGGSILRTSRENPLKSANGIPNAIESLRKIGITHLITIGGDDTASSAARISKETKGEIKVVHVPKTIDNDLPLPEGISTFGFQSARHFGAYIVQNLMEDAKTTTRWYVAVTMGRKAGFLALGICFAAGAPLSIIPEEFPNDKASFKQLCDVVECTILKRRSMGKDHGVIILAEGLAEFVAEEEGQDLGKAERDEFGHLRLAEFDLGKAVKEEIKRRFAARAQKITVVDKEIGYELRCCSPIPFDIDYTRRLGYGAVRCLLDGKTDMLISYRGAGISPIPFSEIMDEKSGAVRTRKVDINSEYYKVAISYMIKLRKSDLSTPDILKSLADNAKLPEKEFISRYSYLVES